MEEYIKNGVGFEEVTQQSEWQNLCEYLQQIRTGSRGTFNGVVTIVI